MTISLLSKRRTRYFFFAGVRSSCLFTNVSQPFSRSLMLRCPEDIRNQALTKVSKVTALLAKWR